MKKVEIIYTGYLKNMFNEQKFGAGEAIRGGNTVIERENGEAVFQFGYICRKCKKKDDWTGYVIFDGKIENLQDILEEVESGKKKITGLGNLTITMYD